MPVMKHSFGFLLRGFLLIVAGLVIICESGVLSRFEWRWLDWQMRFLAGREHAYAEDPVVVVGIDDASLAQFAVPLATLHRQIGGFLEAMALAHPRAVGVDVVLPQASYDRIQPGLDAALARGILALRPAAPLVLGMTAAADGRLRPLHPLFTNLATPAGLGLVFVSKDDDGVIRRHDERLVDTQAKMRSLVGQLAQRIEIPMQNGLIPFFRGPRFGYFPLKDVNAGMKGSHVAV